MPSEPKKCEAELPDDCEAWGLEALRARIRLLERGAGRAPCDGLVLGLPSLDAVLPAGGLPLAALHEIAPGKPLAVNVVPSIGSMAIAIGTDSSAHVPSFSPSKMPVASSLRPSPIRTRPRH